MSYALIGSSRGQPMGPWPVVKLGTRARESTNGGQGSGLRQGGCRNRKRGGAVRDRHKAAEQRVAKLLKSEVAQDFRDRLGTALNAEHDPDARKVLDKIIDSLRAQIDDRR
jgi:hypothetical protein